MTVPTEPKQRRSREETRDHLLSAARRMMLDKGKESPVDIRLLDVVREEGLTTGAAYQIWASQDEFRRDVAIYVASNFEWATPRLIIDQVKELVADDAPREERIRVAGRLYFEAFSRNREYLTVLQLFAVREPSSELTEALRHGYDIVHDGFAHLVESLLAMEGKRVRAPYTIDDLAVLATALTEGLTLRVSVQPDRVRTVVHHDPDGDREWHIYSAALFALSEQFTEDIPESST